MSYYVLVIKKRNSYKIGRIKYTKNAAQKRLEELKEFGILNMKIMSINEALGL